MNLETSTTTDSTAAPQEVIAAEPSFVDNRGAKGNVAVLEEKLGIDLRASNTELESKTAPERVSWALDHFQPDIVLSSSFGAQSAVSLHLVASQWPEVPVLLADTGYLFPETYEFIDHLTEKLSLNLKIYRSPTSPADQEKRFGKLWEQGLNGIEKYNQINKVEPMNRALDELQAKAWLTGLRRDQSRSRENLPVLAVASGRLKIHPIVDWSDKDIFDYMNANDLPYHPLWEKGYVSIGDWHTSRQLTDGLTAEETRFFGLKRECGLHEEVDFVI